MANTSPTTLYQLELAVAAVKGKFDAFEDIYATKAEVGSPLVAALKADMTDHDKIYVYTGSETGMTSGHWYYWNGSAWADGGVYNSTAFVTDTTLSVEGMAADAEAVGDAIDTVCSVINGNIASAYDHTATYHVGELVIYQNGLYKCSTEISTAEEWNAAHWTAVKISEIAAMLNNYSMLLNEEIPNTVQNYTFANGTVTQVVHNRSGVAVRTDNFVYTPGLITETRMLVTGENLTIATNLDTLETAITYIA